jgi:hypothetical protein
MSGNFASILYSYIALKEKKIFQMNQTFQEVKKSLNPGQGMKTRKYCISIKFSIAFE